jgi:hypothetical protein
MTHSALVYRGIEKLLLAELPELRGPLEKKFGSYYDLKTEMPEAYPVFEDVLQEFLFELLDADRDDPLLPRAFKFLEEMATSQDKEVVNLLWIAILEPLVPQRERLRRSWKYMGGKTRELTREMARSAECLDNLPPGYPFVDTE